ncbi:uncharacterized protein [Panulirus ornatus]|uniref:uncharacterized protein isoform X2 n=1 Tax=Panulirus ornatus TaxID=150431 RepID=UPI003A862AD4
MATWSLRHSPCAGGAQGYRSRWGAVATRRTGREDKSFGPAATTEQQHWPDLAQRQRSGLARPRLAGWWETQPSNVASSLTLGSGTSTNVTLTSRLLLVRVSRAWGTTAPRPSSLWPGLHETATLLQMLTTETGTHQKPASKVRVTFYESSKPLVVTSPEPSEFDQFYPQDLIMASPITDGHMPAFDRQLSTDSGRDNPFRPDGDISREADEIVQLIKSGRPLQGQAGQTPDVTDSLDVTPSSPTEKDAVVEPLVPAKDVSPQQQQPPQQLQQPSPDTVPSKPVTDNTPSSPEKAGANGSAAPENSTPGTVEVTHVTVTPTDAAHVEHVVIKKKSKCNCCVIQ